MASLNDIQHWKNTVSPTHLKSKRGTCYEATTTPSQSCQICHREHKVTASFRVTCPRCWVEKQVPHPTKVIGHMAKWGLNHEHEGLSRTWSWCAQMSLSFLRMTPASPVINWNTLSTPRLMTPQISSMCALSHGGWIVAVWCHMWLS
jgi:hypothetical protein